MEQHAVPREITSFQFKLIGWLTVKQFIYLLLSTGLAIAMFFITKVVLPIPYVDFIVAGLIGAAGAGFSLLKYNEREIDVWIGNLINSLLSPSQYHFIKNNPAPDFLQGIYLNPGTAQTHVDASEKLNKYMSSTGQKKKTDQKQQKINTMLHQKQAPTNSSTVPQPKTPTQSNTTIQGADPQQNQSQKQQQTTPSNPTPFLSGVVRNNKNEPLPDIMVYINTEAGQVARILKTNHHGVFATFHNLPSGEYTLNPKDLGGNYFFDTMNITVDGRLNSPIDIYSKELL